MSPPPCCVTYFPCFAAELDGSNGIPVTPPVILTMWSRRSHHSFSHRLRLSSWGVRRIVGHEDCFRSICHAIRIITHLTDSSSREVVRKPVSARIFDP